MFGDILRIASRGADHYSAPLEYHFLRDVCVIRRSLEFLSGELSIYLTFELARHAAFLV